MFYCKNVPTKNIIPKDPSVFYTGPIEKRQKICYYRKIYAQNNVTGARSLRFRSLETETQTPPYCLIPGGRLTTLYQTADLYLPYGRREVKQKQKHIYQKVRFPQRIDTKKQK